MSFGGTATVARPPGYGIFHCTQAGFPLDSTHPPGPPTPLRLAGVGLHGRNEETNLHATIQRYQRLTLPDCQISRSPVKPRPWILDNLTQDPYLQLSPASRLILSHAPCWGFSSFLILFLFLLPSYHRRAHLFFGVCALSTSTVPLLRRTWALARHYQNTSYGC